MQKELAIFTTLLSLGASSLYSGDSIGMGKSIGECDDQIESLNKRVTNLENAATAVKAQNRGNLYFSGEVLYWRVEQEGLPIAISTPFQTATNTVPDPLNGNVINPDFSWDVGYRLALGGRFGETRNDIAVKFMNMEADSKTSVHAQDGEMFWSVWTRPANYAYACRHAIARTEADMKIVDLELGHTFTPSKWFNFRTSFGLQALWLDQSVGMQYSGFVSNPPAFRSVSEVNIKMKNNFHALGPKLGVDLAWPIMWGMSFIGSGEAALPYGKFELAFREKVDGTLSQVADSFHSSRLVYKYLVGLRFDYSDEKENAHFGLQVGWENVNFNSLSQFNRFMDDVAVGNFLSTNGSFSAQGLSIQASVSF